MELMLLVHIAGGGAGLVAGAVALASPKGARLHCQSGRLFVYAMLTMAASGALMAISEGAGPVINVPAALLTGYLVLTALTTVRPRAAGRRRDVGLMVFAFVLGVASVILASRLAAAGGREAGMAFPLFMFGFVGLLSGAGDFRMIRAGGLQGPRRLARHLWRMCFALWIAAASFFLGQADEFPEAVRIPGLLALPVLAVLATMLYWLWRVRRRKPFRGILPMNPARA